MHVWTDENGGFQIQWCHKHYACSVRDAIVFLSFKRIMSSGMGENDSNTQRVNEHFVLKTEEKISENDDPPKVATSKVVSLFARNNEKLKIQQALPK